MPCKPAATTGEAAAAGGYICYATGPATAAAARAAGLAATATGPRSLL